MDRELSAPPEIIDELAARCVEHVKQRIGFDLDYQYETLGVLEYFIDLLVKEEGGGLPPPPGDYRRTHLVHLLAPAVGAYFGEVLRRRYQCRWRLRSEDPREWVLEFENVFLRFNPLGAAAEAFIEQAVETWGGAIVTAPEEREALAKRLDAAPPVAEDDFYKLTTRWEAVQIIEDWLNIRLVSRDGASRSTFFTAEDYDRTFD